jgi:hypothetical protein
MLDKAKRMDEDQFLDAFRQWDGNKGYDIESALGVCSSSRVAKQQKIMRLPVSFLSDNVVIGNPGGALLEKLI